MVVFWSMKLQLFVSGSWQHFCRLISILYFLNWKLWFRIFWKYGRIRLCTLTYLSSVEIKVLKSSELRTLCSKYSDVILSGDFYIDFLKGSLKMTRYVQCTTYVKGSTFLFVLPFLIVRFVYRKDSPIEPDWFSWHSV